MKRTNITLEEAERIVLTLYPKERLVSVVELPDKFVFNTRLKSQNGDSKHTFKPLLSIDKNGGWLKVFNPLHDANREYLDAVKKSIKYY